MGLLDDLYAQSGLPFTWPGTSGGFPAMQQPLISNGGYGATTPFGGDPNDLNGGASAAAPSAAAANPAAALPLPRPRPQGAPSALPVAAGAGDPDAGQPQPDSASPSPLGQPASSAPGSQSGPRSSGPDFGDRLTAGLKGFVANAHTGPIGALLGGAGALISGQAPGSLTARALAAKGVAPEDIAAANANPDVMKQLVNQYFVAPRAQAGGGNAGASAPVARRAPAAATAPSGQAVAASLANARAAIAANPGLRGAVIARLRASGIDPSGL